MVVVGNDTNEERCHLVDIANGIVAFTGDLGELARYITATVFVGFYGLLYC